MWDRLLVDCNIATFEESPGNPLGLIENGAIAIADGKVLRVGKRTELAGFRAKSVDALGGAWVTPGLIDCHTHLVFAGTRADEHAMRRAGASYEEIAHVEKIMREGTGADRQIAAWEREHNMHDVVDLIVAETYERLTVPQPRKIAGAHA